MSNPYVSQQGVPGQYPPSQYPPSQYPPVKHVRALVPRKVAVQVVHAISYLIYIYLIAVEIILFLGFFLLLFGANPTADFVGWAYRSLDRVMEPFRGIFTPIELGTTSGDVQAVFETSVLFAMIVYGIVWMVMSSFIDWLSRRLGYLEAAEADEQAQAWADAQAAEAQAAEAYAAAQASMTTYTTPTPSVPQTPPPAPPQAPPPAPPSSPQV